MDNTEFRELLEQLHADDPQAGDRERNRAQAEILVAFARAIGAMPPAASVASANSLVAPVAKAAVAGQTPSTKPGV